MGKSFLMPVMATALRYSVTSLGQGNFLFHLGIVFGHLAINSCLEGIYLSD